MKRALVGVLVLVALLFAASGCDFLRSLGIGGVSISAVPTAPVVATAAPATADPKLLAAVASAKAEARRAVATCASAAAVAGARFDALDAEMRKPTAAPVVIVANSSTSSNSSLDAGAPDASTAADGGAP